MVLNRIGKPTDLYSHFNYFVMNMTASRSKGANTYKSIYYVLYFLLCVFYIQIAKIFFMI